MSGTPYGVYGKVYDSDGTTILANVRVSLLNANTNDSLTMDTNAQGEFSFDMANLSNGYADGHEISIYTSYGRYYDEEIHTVDTSTGIWNQDLTIEHALATAVRYCTIEQVRRFVTVAADYDTDSINDMIGHASALIDERTKRTWKGIQTVTDEYYDGNDTDLLWLNHVDVQTITSLSIDDDDDGTYTSITVADYVKHKTGENVIVLDREAEVSCFTSGTNTVKITYTYGNSMPTERVRRLALLIVQNMINFDGEREKQIESELNRLKFKGPIGLI